MNDALDELVQEIKPTLALAGIKEEKVLPILSEGRNRELVHKLLSDLVAKELKDFKQARALIPENMWAYYEASGQHGHRECKILAEAKRNLKEAWRLVVKGSKVSW